MENNSEIFLARIRQLQNSRSVSAFAAFIGVNQKTLDHIVKGERKLSVEVLISICSKCGVTADWLLGLDEEHAVSTDSIRANIAESKLSAVKKSLIALLKNL